MTRSELEQAAMEAHRQGVGWIEFHRQYAEAIAQLEPYDRRGYRRLTDRLLHLVVSGDRSGQFGVGDPDAPDPWELDDQVTETERISEVRSMWG